MRRLAFAILLLTTGLLAQNGPYYVNGSTGKDIPGNGTSADPWKTIGYAFSRIPRPPSYQSSDILYVAGGQVYSPSTNGESFPLTPVYNIAVEGQFAGTTMPVIRIPSGRTGFRFPGNEWFNRNQVTFRYLILEGGDHGMEMGAAPGYRHRPRVQDCRFRNQRVAGIRIANRGNAIDDPRFFQNDFTGPGRGIEGFASGTHAIVQPDVEECRFHDLGGTAIVIRDRSPGGGNVGGLFRSNWYERCGAGVLIHSDDGAVTTNARIRTSRFKDLRGYAVDILLSRPYDPAVVVEQCAMLDCVGGVRMRGTPLPGSYTLTITDSVIRGCRRGVEVAVDGQGNVGITCRRNRIADCDHGMNVTVNPPFSGGLQFAMTAERNRVLGGNYGVRLRGNAAGTVDWTSGMICGARYEGLYVATDLVVTARSLTLADHGTGLRVGYAGGGSAFDHLVFAANGQDVAQPSPVPLTYCCFEGTAIAGAGNLNLTNPRLVRPFYKLAPSSPCIDAGNVAAALPATDYEGDPRASVGVAGGSPLPDLGADEYVHGGSVSVYGTHGFGRFNVFPRISSPNTGAHIGGSLTVDLDGAVMPYFGVTAVFSVLSYGFRDDSGPYPFDLAAFNMAGSYLWNDFVAEMRVPVTASGTASRTLAIPPDPNLVGVTAAFQYFAAMPPPYGVVGSDGLRVTIGQ